MKTQKRTAEARRGLNRRDLVKLGAGSAAAAALGTVAAGPISAAEASDFPTPTYVNVPGSGDGNQLRMAVYEQGPEDATVPVVFSHGFPELAYSWRHQLPALAKTGYRAIAPDQRGYGKHPASARHRRLRHRRAVR